MRAFAITVIAAAALAVMSCGRKNGTPAEKPIGTSTAIEGDSTLYGLACDGCTDSVLVFLPGQGGDPVVYNIIDAMRRRRVAGHPRVGDWVCLTLDSADRSKADIVIDLDELKGTWVQKVMPKIRNTETFIDSDKEVQAMEDSILKARMVPVEIGFSLKRHYTAAPTGIRHPANLESEESPVVYPTPKFYTEWHIFNGRLVLTEGALTMQNSKTRTKKKYENDTVDIVMLTKDSLRLKFKDGNVRGYYRKN